MTGQEMGQAVSIYGQLVSGMTVAEAAAAVGASSYTTGSGKITSFPMTQLKGGKPVTIEAQYAAQVWEYYKTAAGAAGITSLGAAASAVKSWASGVLFGDPALAGTLAGTGGLLTMSLPTAAVVAAPLLGVSLGGTLYESNPELWNKISEALLPWAYADTFDIAAVVDDLGQVFLPKGLIDALSDLFEEEGIGGIPGEYVSPTYGDLCTVQSLKYETEDQEYEIVANGCELVNDQGALFGFAISVNTGTVVTKYRNKPSGNWITFTTNINLLAGSTFIEGHTVYYRQVLASVPSSALDPSVPYIPSGLPDTYNNRFRCYATIRESGTPVGEYPEGTSQWEGDLVDPASLTPKYVVTDPSTGDLAPYYPVTLPTGDPTVSPDPEIEPDPTAPVEWPELDPYISPVIDPEMWPEELPMPTPHELEAPQTRVDPIYIPEPDLNPNNDPSLLPDPEPALEDEPSPISEGTTPPILFPVPDVPWPTIIPSSGSGLIHVYNPTPAEFVAFGNWLWVTYADPSIEKLWNNPFDGVIGAHELYATPSNDGTDTIKSGFLDSGISAALVRLRYTSINCGSIVIPEYWGNYLDYSPYSKAFIYLPFIGIVEVDVDDIVGHSVNVLYHVDSYNGSCIAQITVARDEYTNTVYQFSGNCAVDLPLAGGSQAAIRAGLISSAASGIGSTINGIINGAAFGGLAGALIGGVTGAVGGVANAVANVVSQKSTVQHSGTFGASYGAMGIKRPYIIIRRPIQKLVNEYQNDYGYPAHKRVVIGACTGFLRAREVHVLSTLATDEEKKKIEQMLKEGVYVTE